MATPGIAGHRVPPEWGTALTEGDYLSLEQSWISRQIADAAMLRRVDTMEGRRIVGQKGQRDCAGVLIPYYLPDGSQPHTYRIRRDNPDCEFGSDGNLKRTAKYLGAPGGANRLYLPPGVTAEQLRDPEIPVVLVEGEKKALALCRLAHHETDTPRFIPVAIAGVWNWRGKTGKTPGPNGGWLYVKGPIPDLGLIEWSGRIAYILFDANVHSNDSVKWARSRLARELASRKAEVKFINLPPDCGVNGVDDLLQAWGPERVLELFSAASSAARLAVVIPPQYKATPEGMVRITGRDDRLTQYHLTNFNAKVLSNILSDDGVELTRDVEIEAELFGNTYRFTIPATVFNAMNWPMEQLGANAIIHPNQKEYARVAIQSLSLGASDQRVYTHTGWRKTGSGWVYLHGGGGIGAEGTVAGTLVRLSGSLRRYELALPRETESTKRSVQASLRVLDLAPPQISFPLLAATYRAALQPADFSVHLVGETGAFKSEAAALCQQHFGAGMDRQNLPGTWSSTGNALEMLAFHAKDALLVIDDFAPQGGPNEAAKLHAAAERVFRGAGNHAGRGRLDSNSRLREPKPPRALILSTGEDIPRGQSVRARLLILELVKGAISGSKLSACQHDAREGLYAQAMAGFIRWLAGRREEATADFQASVLEYRDESPGGTHARTPEIVANLRAGFDLFLAFATGIGAITSNQANELADRCRQALSQAAAAQAKYQGETEPAGRFVSLLQSVLSSGQAHLETRTGCAPESLEKACGWRREGGEWRSQGPCVGWLGDDDLYLDVTAAYNAVQRMARDSGDALAVAESTLKRRLRDKKLLASTDETRNTLTVRRRIGGSSKDVLHLHRTTILPDDQDTPEDAR